MDLSVNLLNTLERLCNLKSTSGTEEEARAAEGIYSIISEIGYFKEHRDNLRLHRIEGDQFGRSFVSALYKKGESKKTVILLSHFDVVGIEEYGHLKHLAYSPSEYTKKLKYEKLPDDIMKELLSEDYLFGRGTMDMKCGLALHIEIIRYLYDNDMDMDGNILLITVPDEENSSMGMLAASEYLSELKDDGYEFQVCINSESSFQKYPGDENRYIYTGTLGKLLPFIFFAGVETHCSQPFEGISASLLSSVTTSLIEVNTDLCERYGNYAAPPPVCLKQEDFKQLYNVSTPAFSYAYYNYLTLTSSPEDVLSKIKEICSEAFEKAISKMKEQALKYSKLSDTAPPDIEIKPNILTYEELVSIVEKKGVNIDEIKAKCKNRNIDTREMTETIISDLIKHLPGLRPLMVIGFAPPYYPHRISSGNKKVMDIATKVIQRADDVYGEKLIHRDAFSGLCDLSYTGFDNPEHYFALKNNMPVFDIGYNLPVKALSNINIPGMVLGPFGKDAHKYTERLYMPYSFHVTPDLLLYAIEEFLK